MPTLTELLFASLFFLLAFTEWIITRIRKLPYYNWEDSFLNISVGIIGFASSLIFTPLSYLLFTKISYFAPIHIQNTAASWVVLFFMIDFIGYWHHRLSHKTNLLWAAHIVHHQSEHYNMTVAIRTSVLTPATQLFFYSILPLLGFSPEVVSSIFVLQGIFQLLVHTQHIKKMGVLEYLFVTPSAHRVHHGRNDIYIDKNYGVVFILWDKIFGTYEPEIETVVYGVTSPILHADPYNVTVGYFQSLFNRSAHLTKKERWQLWLSPPAWKGSAEQDLGAIEQGNLERKTVVKVAFYGGIQILIAYLSLLCLLQYSNHSFTFYLIINLLVTCLSTAAVLEGLRWGFRLEILRFSVFLVYLSSLFLNTFF